jgi:hypothetical protein
MEPCARKPKRVEMKPVMGVTVDRILECAVVVSWTDLLQSGQSGSIHVEYCFSPKGSVDSLKLWVSTTRGHWHLACEYSVSVSTHHRSVVHFEQGYESAELARNLELIMRYPDAFQPALNHDRHGLLQLCVPTQQETETAFAAIAAGAFAAGFYGDTADRLTRDCIVLAQNAAQEPKW